MNGQRKRSATLGCVSLIAVFFVALAAFGLAYQAKLSYYIDVGARTDKPYVTGFNDREPPLKVQKPEDQTFRWTRTNSYIDLPGIASQNITVTLNVTASSNPNHQLTVYVNNHLVPLSQTLLSGNSYNQISFAVPGEWFNDGNLHLKFVSQVFNPPNDSRNLGAALDWVKITPRQTGFFPFVRPPADSFLPLLIVAVLGVLILFSIGVPTPFSFLGGFAVIGGMCYWLINDRLSLTVLIQQNFTETLFFIWLVVWAVAELGPKVYKLFGIAVTRRESGWLAGLLLLQFVLLYGVMLHPQFASSDVGLDVNNLLYKAEAGNYFFTTELPNGLAQPYPPSYYLFLQPLAALTDNSRPALTNLIQLVNAALQASGVLLVYFLSSMLRQLPRKITDKDLVLREEMEHGWEVGTNWAGILACAVYVICRYTYLIFSQGNFTNLFGSWVFLLFLSVIAGTLSYFRNHQGIILSRFRRFKAVDVSVSLPVEKIEKGEGIFHYRRGTDKNTSVTALLPAQIELEHNQLNEVEESSLEIEPPIQAKLNEETFSRRLEDNFESPAPSLLQNFGGDLAVYLKKAVWPRFLAVLRYLLPLFLLIVAFTSHYGVFLFTNVFMFCFILIMAILGGFKGQRDAIYLVAIYLLAVTVSYLLYYSNQLISNSIALEFSSSLSGGGASKRGIDVGLVFKHLYTQIRDDFGLLIIFAAIGGVALWLASWWHAAFKYQGQSVIGWRQRFSIAVIGRITPLNALLFALFLTGIFFALLSEVIGLESRYQLYLLPLIALAAGALLARIWRSSVVGVVMVLALVLFQFLSTVSFWLDRLTYYPG